jgi:NAD(P)-dependent dehydrogenase (short-subunit alcohol dehydrogenase family)
MNPSAMTVRTPWSADVSAACAALGGLAGLHPVGLIGQPVDVAAMRAWLTSSEAGLITGQIGLIDGGRTCLLPAP